MAARSLLGKATGRFCTREGSIFGSKIRFPTAWIFWLRSPLRAHLDLGAGCEHLPQELWRVRPKLHVCGHIHAAAGTKHLAFGRLQQKYEGLVLRNNLSSLFAFLTAALGKLSFAGGDVEAKTTAVNAAVVGGMRDGLRRGAAKVYI